MAIGALGSAPFTKFGKKICIHITNFVVMIACGLQQVKRLEVILAGRFLYGICGGAFSVFVPSFINEVIPIELKGYFGCSTQIFLTFGIMIANLLGVPLPRKTDPVEETFL